MKRKKISSFAPDWSVRLFNLFIGFVGVAIHVYALRQMQAGIIAPPWPFLLLVLLADAYLLWSIIMFSMQTRVTLYDEGVEIERGNSKLFTTWENVSHLGKNGMGTSAATGLYLHEAVKTEAQGIERLFFRENTKFIPLGRFVNMPSNLTSFFSREADLEKILESEIGKQLFELAPHLFGAEEKLKNQLEDGLEENQAELEEAKQYGQSQA